MYPATRRDGADRPTSSSVWKWVVCSPAHVPAWCCENDRHCSSNSAGDGGEGAPAHVKRDRDKTGLGGSGRNAAAIHAVHSSQKTSAIILDFERFFCL